MASARGRRAAVLDQVVKGDWTLAEAAERMEVSYRQAKRLRKRYEKEGAAGLAPGNGGRESNRAITTNVRERVLRLIDEKYGGEKGRRFGPTLLAEHLASEDSIEIGTSTLGRWMLEAGLWSRERKLREHRSRRSRKDHFGELVQLDGSFHEWLEGTRAAGVPDESG